MIKSPSADESNIFRGAPAIVEIINLPELTASTEYVIKIAKIKNPSNINIKNCYINLRSFTWIGGVRTPVHFEKFNFFLDL